MFVCFVGVSFCLCCFEGGCGLGFVDFVLGGCLFCIWVVVCWFGFVGDGFMGVVELIGLLFGVDLLWNSCLFVVVCLIWFVYFGVWFLVGFWVWFGCCLWLVVGVCFYLLVLSLGLIAFWIWGGFNAGVGLTMVIWFYLYYLVFTGGDCLFCVGLNLFVLRWWVFVLVVCVTTECCCSWCVVLI